MSKASSNEYEESIAEAVAYAAGDRAVQFRADLRKDWNGRVGREIPFEHYAKMVLGTVKSSIADTAELEFRRESFEDLNEKLDLRLRHYATSEALSALRELGIDIGDEVTPETVERRAAESKGDSTDE